MNASTDHKARMQRLKASVDRRIEAAQEERGILIVFTGAGKGKTTAALGHGHALYRARHEGGDCAVYQRGN